MGAREQTIIDFYQGVKLGNLDWIDCGRLISDYLIETGAEIKQTSQKLNIGASTIKVYARGYEFVKQYAPQLLRNKEFKHQASSSRLDKLRRLAEKRIESIPDFSKNPEKFIDDLTKALPEKAKTMLLEEVDESIPEVSEKDIVHTELMIHIVSDKAQDILKDDKARAELRKKMGPHLHKCAVLLESIFDPEFAASVEAGVDDKLEFNVGGINEQME